MRDIENHQDIARFISNFKENSAKTSTKDPISEVVSECHDENFLKDPNFSRDLYFKNLTQNNAKEPYQPFSNPINFSETNQNYPKYLGKEENAFNSDKFIQEFIRKSSNDFGKENLTVPPMKSNSQKSASESEINWEEEYKKLKETHNLRIGEYQAEVQGLAKTIQKLSGESGDNKLKKIIRHKDKRIGELMKKMDTKKPRPSSVCRVERQSLDSSKITQIQKEEEIQILRDQVEIWSEKAQTLANSYLSSIKSLKSELRSCKIEAHKQKKLFKAEMEQKMKEVAERYLAQNQFLRSQIKQLKRKQKKNLK